MTKPLVTVPILLASMLNCLCAVADTSDPMLDEAIATYNQGFDAEQREERVRLFRRSEILFGQVIAKARRPSADLWVNLGNAALGAERIGPAIHGFREALVVDPGHRRARQNLDFARTLLPEWVPRPDDSGASIGSFFAWTGGASVSSLFRMASWFFLAACLLLAVGIRWRRSGVRNAAVLPALAWLVLWGLGVWKMQEATSPMAVVTLPGTIARSADSPRSPPRLPEPLPSGAEVEIVEQRDDWLRVRLYDGRDVWVPASALERITQSA